MSLRDLPWFKFIPDDIIYAQGHLCINGKMNVRGVCFGLTTDWIKYSFSNPNDNYFIDKYYAKYTIDDPSTNVPVSKSYKYSHKLFSENYYNRINYYQASQYNDSLDPLFNNFTKDFYSANNNELPDIAYIYYERIMNGKYEYGHACSYKITNAPNQTYSFLFFDPNFGEIKGGNYRNKEEVVTALKQHIKDHNIYKYDNDYNKTLYVVNSTNLVSKINALWKKDKLYIASKGIGENSLHYNDIKSFIKNEYSPHTYYGNDISNIANEINGDYFS
ncbi:MAG: hypothetical protein J0H68_01625 [Sphingobacteriia bacterium]|nr:hypothetical protein [Sphingobacteriia bacterium]